VEFNDDERDKRVYTLNVNIKKQRWFIYAESKGSRSAQPANQQGILFRISIFRFANWYKVQAQEERDHAMLFYQYLQNNNCPVTLEAIEKPNVKLENTMDALKAGLVHEEYVTSLINAICAAAHEVNDFRTLQFLDWFIKEQGEEETNATDLITKMELFGSDPKSLYMLNSELAARVYTAPSLVL